MNAKNKILDKDWSLKDKNLQKKVEGSRVDPNIEAQS